MLPGNVQAEMTRQLDSTDREILRQLKANARMPLVALARAIGRSRSATQERLQRLEREGTIAGYTLRTRPAPQTGLTAWLHVSTKTGTSCTDIAPQLQAMPEALQIYSLSGKPDLAALIQVATQDELLRVRQAVAAMSGVSDVQTQLVLINYSGR